MFISAVLPQILNFWDNPYFFSDSVRAKRTPCWSQMNNVGNQYFMMKSCSTYTAIHGFCDIIQNVSFPLNLLQTSSQLQFSTTSAFPSVNERFWQPWHTVYDISIPVQINQHAAEPELLEWPLWIGNWGDLPEFARQGQWFENVRLPQESRACL